MLSLIVNVLGLFLVQCVVTNSEHAIQTRLGLIRGLKSADGNYSMYLGIPYALVDERNPFGPSLPHPEYNYNNIINATSDDIICPQQQEFDGIIAGSLDCLRLNIFVPDTFSKSKLPVLVLLHGGGFTTGHSKRNIFGPKFLVRHDIIFVTLNYRLGPYGFMCLHTKSVPGNQGLKDQVLALRWIRDNIDAFGGDSDSVTIMGESAGARSIDLHILSPQEKLFNRAIIQSGSAFNAGWFPKPDLEAPQKLAAKIGFSTDNRDEALTFLSQSAPELIIKAALETNIIFRLCIEKDFEDTEKFIVDHPLNTNAVKAAGMSLLIGYNSHEMLARYYVYNDPEFFKNLNIFEEYLQRAFNFPDSTLSELTDVVRRFYIGDEEMSANIRNELGDFDSDTTYIHSTQRNIDKYIKNEVDSIFHYVFSYNGQRNFLKRLLNIFISGALHVDERGYLYDIKMFSEQPSIEDQNMIDILTTMWTNFVKYGDPTPWPTELIAVKWLPITKGSTHNHMNIDSELTMGKRHYNERMAFWDLFYKANEEFEVGFNSSPAVVINSRYLMLLLTTIGILYKWQN